MGRSDMEAIKEKVDNAKKEEAKAKRKELKKQMICYIDQVYHKEITVLLYSYYRHFWCLDDKDIEKYADIIMALCDCLSDSGRRSLEEKNKDIFYEFFVETKDVLERRAYKYFFQRVDGMI